MEIFELEPQNVWRNFYALTQIPRPSGHTEQVANFLVDFAKKNGAEAHIDETGNVAQLLVSKTVRQPSFRHTWTWCRRR